MIANVRKIIVQVDEVHQEMGQSVSPPTRRALAHLLVHFVNLNDYFSNVCDHGESDLTLRVLKKTM